MPACKVGVHAPAADKFHLASLGIVLRVDVERADLLECRAGRVLKDRAHIDDAQATAVIGLVCETVDDVLVVVD